MDNERLKDLHRYWSAANYLTVGQIYLRDNALLREPLRLEHGLTIEQVDDVLNHGAGLLGVSGVSSDFRRAEAAAGGGDERWAAAFW